MVEIIHSEIQRENNDSLKELILKEIEQRPQWINEIKGVVGAMAENIAVGVMAKKAVYASLGCEINLFVPSLNGYICWDKTPTDKEDSLPTMSDIDGIYAKAVKDGIEYTFMSCLLVEGVIDRGLASSYKFMGAVSTIYPYNELRDDLTNRANGKIPELSADMREFITNYDYTDKSVKLQVKEIQDKDSSIEDKEFYAKELTQKLLIASKSVEGLGGRKPKNYEVSVLLFVRKMFGIE